MLKRLILAASCLVLMPLAAVGQSILAPDSLYNTVTCAQFSGMDFDGQMAALSAFPTAGDDMGAEDQGAAKDWARTVEKACEGRPDALLADVATEAFGGN